MSAVAVLVEALAAGVRLRVDERGQVRAAGVITPDLLARLRAHKAELLELLRGDRCRGCGQRLAWPDAVGVVHGDGLASCFACYAAIPAGQRSSESRGADERCHAPGSR